MTESEPTPDHSQGQAPDFQQILAALQSLYPQCFPTDGAALKPLKIGIHKDLLARGGLPEDITATRLRNFLAWYTKRYRHRKMPIKGGQRVDLEDNPSDEVTEEQSANVKLSFKSKAPPPPPGSPQAQLPVDAPLTYVKTD